MRFLAEKQWHKQALGVLIGNDPAIRSYTTSMKRQLGPAMQQVLDRAKATNQLRADVVVAKPLTFRCFWPVGRLNI